MDGILKPVFFREWDDDTVTRFAFSKSIESMEGPACENCHWPEIWPSVRNISRILALWLKVEKMHYFELVEVSCHEKVI